MPMMTVREFTKDFVWEADGAVDSYHILKKGERGDCDDFAVTVAYLEAGGLRKMWKKILTKRTQFHWCVSVHGDPHIILFVKEKGWIDNIYRDWRDEPLGHTKIRYLIVFWPAIKLIVGKFIAD